jgi:hypothetical protein
VYTSETAGLLIEISEANGPRKAEKKDPRLHRGELITW